MFQFIFSHIWFPKFHKISNTAFIVKLRRGALISQFEFIIFRHIFFLKIQKSSKCYLTVKYCQWLLYIQVEFVKIIVYENRVYIVKLQRGALITRFQLISNHICFLKIKKFQIHPLLLTSGDKL